MPTVLGTKRYDQRVGREGVADLRQAFTFLRQHADRRYSSRTLLKVLECADAMDAGAQFSPPVCIVTCHTPPHYDEETEVKSGGVLGVAVQLPDRRMILAVREEVRRQHVGTHLLSKLERLSSPNYGVFWLHASNTTGQMFALSVGMEVREFRGSNYAVAYSRVDLNDDVADVSRLEPETRRPRLPRLSDIPALLVEDECDQEEY